MMHWILIEQVQQPIVQIIPVAIEYQIPIPDVLILEVSLISHFGISRITLQLYHTKIKILV
jgi:hypothetical protein